MVRRLVVEAPFETIVESEQRLLLLNPNGHAEILDETGRVITAVDVGLTAVTQAAAVPGGWVAIGSLPVQERQERGAAVRIGMDGSLGPRWQAPGLFLSLTANQDATLAGDIVGPVFSLNQNGSLEAIPVPADVQGGLVRTVSWGGRLAFCKDGERRPNADPYGLCVSKAGVRVREIWSTPPIECNGFLIANVQADGRVTSPWSRAVWSDMGAKDPVLHPLAGKPGDVACIGRYLVDTKAPGELLSLPELASARTRLCSSEVDTVVVGPSGVWCLERERVH